MAFHHLQTNKLCSSSPYNHYPPPFSTNPKILELFKNYPPIKLNRNPLVSFSKSCSLSSSHSIQTVEAHEEDEEHTRKKKKMKKRVFFLDVNPLCYKGSTPSLQNFAFWISIFFSQVSLTDPVIAVIDGERGNEYRRQMLPSYKANRRKSSPGIAVERSHKRILDLLHKCNVPVVKIEAYEADDVVATLVAQVLQMGYRAVVASPDKDFKQLLSEDVQIVMPITEFRRWSFYTLKHYVAQYNCDPQSDLSLRCILGDEIDGVPGLQHVVPEFGRKTAQKLVKKHGSLEELLNAAAVRTVGKQYAQDALTKYADYLRRNYEILSLKRDVDVHIEEGWLSERNACNDSVILSDFVNLLRESQNPIWQNKSLSKQLHWFFDSAPRVESLTYKQYSTRELKLLEDGFSEFMGLER